MHDLKQGSKEQVIQDFLMPSYQPDLEDPIYKGLEFLLNTYLPDGTYHVYDQELNYENKKAAAFVGDLKQGKQIAKFKHHDVYHIVYEYTQGKTKIIAVSYNGCPFSSALTIYFIREF